MIVRLITGIISIIANVVFFIVLRLDLYTDHAVLGDGETHTWHRSPLDRMYTAGSNTLVDLQFFFAIVSVISSILLMFGVKNNIVRIVQLISTLASLILFICMMIYAGHVHPKY
ncbi:MAG: hypothetical protein IK115_01795 [Lachnospiraceae bacterium]|nr:hypothetical protein [Lachnospiraceae bacterium]